VSEQLPLCSSKQVVNALKRAGFRPARRSKGSHQTFVREAGGRKYTTVVVLGKRVIPRGTLENILKLAGMSAEEFWRLLR
jgi:predicted RNA binding protein YcfA (HicA-like mRNA interferase family)